MGLRPVVSFIDASVADTIEQDSRDIEVEKVWHDPNETHADVTVTLYADGTATENTVTLSDSKLSDSFTALDMYDLTDGHEIQYTVEEDEVEGYTTSYSSTEANQAKYTITNTIEQDSRDIEVEKVWHDPNETHADVTVTLYADGTATENTVTLSDSKLSDSFTALDMYDLTDGHEIQYTVEEDEVEGYTTSYSSTEANQAKYTITNTIEQDSLNFSVTKIWVDGSNGSATRPEKITLELYRDEESTAIATNEVDVDTADSKAYTFENLPKYAVREIAGYTGAYDGHAFVYSVKEAAVTGYTTTYSSTDKALDKGTITNTLIDPSNIVISGTKTWVDTDGKTHNNAAELTLNLTRTSAKAGSKPEAVAATPVWDGSKYTYSGLEKYDDEGYSYTYDVDEVELPLYTKLPDHRDQRRQRNTHGYHCDGCPDRTDCNSRNPGSRRYEHTDRDQHDGHRSGYPERTHRERSDSDGNGSRSGRSGGACDTRTYG